MGRGGGGGGNPGSSAVLWEVARCLGRSGLKQYVFLGSALSWCNSDSEK